MTRSTDTILVAFTVKTLEVSAGEIINEYKKADVVLELDLRTHNYGTNRQTFSASPTKTDGENIFGCAGTIEAVPHDSNCFYYNYIGSNEPIGMIESKRQDLGNLQVTSHDELYHALAFMSQGEDMPELIGGSGQYSEDYGAILKCKMDDEAKAQLNAELDSCDVPFWLGVLNIGMTTFCADYICTREGSGSGFWEYPLADELVEFVEAQGSIDLYLGDDGKYYT